MSKISNTIAAIAIAVTVTGMSVAFAQDATGMAPTDKCATEGNESMKDMQTGGMQGNMPQTAEMMKMMEDCKSKGATQVMAPQPGNG